MTEKKITFKVGQKVRVKKTGAIGKVVALAPRTNGLWLNVEFGNKKEGTTRRFIRPSAVEKA